MKKACLSCMGVLVTLTLVSGIILSSTHVSADPATSTASANATVIVPSACTLTAVVNTAHSAEVPAGTYQADIGSTTFTTICNDAEGYSIYAVGNANNQYGNNKLLATISGSLAPTYDINTGTNTSGSPSSWAMKLTAAGSTSVPTIASDTSGSFSSYHTVPATNTKVVTYASSTDQSTGSSFTATYAANIAGDQPAGTYNGKVKYTMVHPASNTADEPKDCLEARICYWPNGNGSVIDSMGDQSIYSSHNVTSADLWPSNFQRSGYGFAGWSETYDYSDPTKFYGPNETIEYAAGQYSTNGLSLYAIWIPSAGNLQNWQGCSAMNIGDTTALTDERDNQTYAVARLADGACWMIENLRLNDNTLHNSDGTLAQGYGGVFAGLANPETLIGPFVNANSLYYSGTHQSGTATIDIGTTNPGHRMPRFNNQNSSSPVSNMTSTDSNIYSYGNYYTWSAALANTNNYTSANSQVDGKTSETANTSICPSGWRLPYGNNTGNGATPGGFSKLDIELGGTGASSDSSTTPTGAEMSKLWRKYPNNFIYSGLFSTSMPYSRGSSGLYWSSTSVVSTASHSLLLENSNVNAGTNYIDKYTGYSVRCVTGS